MGSGLDIAISISYDRSGDAKEEVGIVHHLLVLQRCLQTKVGYLDLLRAALYLDET